jgi:hypothetical protein
MKKLLKIIGWIAFVIIMIPVVGFLIIMWSIPENNQQTRQISPEEMARFELRDACRRAIEPTLHNPRSVEWGMNSGLWWQRWEVRMTGENRASVTARFRASNAFGAVILSQITCDAQKSQENWRIIRLRSN